MRAVDGPWSGPVSFVDGRSAEGMHVETEQWKICLFKN